MLESFEIYSKKNKIIRKYFPSYNQESQKICLCLPEDVLNKPSLSVPSLKLFENNTLIATEKLRAGDYLEIMSLQNVKQRTRMIIEYMYSEKNNFAVCGTTNKTEYLTGYFVKYGDGGVDIEPLSDCYKTQIYALAKILKIDPSIIERPSSPDTWSFFISDENFYWRMPFNILDKLLFAQEHNLPMNAIIENTNLLETQIMRAFKHIQGMRSSAKFLSMQPPICHFVNKP
jgi:NAD+ synthase